MKRELQGKYVTISTVDEKAQAFVPAPLPPRPPIDWTAGADSGVAQGGAGPCAVRDDSPVPRR